MTGTPDPGSRAIVIGAGIAGLASSAALTSAGFEVVVVERDVLPDVPRTRPGVPQGHHVHNLLGRAQVMLDSLVPGFTDALRSEGCGEAVVSSETAVFELGLDMPRRDLGLRILCARRPLIEQVLRSAVTSGGFVRVEAARRAVGIELAGSGAVRGVRVRDDAGVEETLSTRLVVDASGSATRIDGWLRDCGVDPPPVERVRCDRWYATVELVRPRGARGDRTFWLTFAVPPSTRTGLVCPVDPEHWYATFSGSRADPAPVSWEDVCRYAATLGHPAISQVLASANPRGPVERFVRREIIRRRFDRWELPITGLVAVGDSVAALDPILGQGMSVAAWQAMALREELRDRMATSGELADATRAHARTANQIADAAHHVGPLVDKALAGPGATPTDLASAAVRLEHIIADDADAHRRYVSVWHLLEPPSIIGAMVGNPGSATEVWEHQAEEGS